jgi:hypothetical protein
MDSLREFPAPVAISRKFGVGFQLGLEFSPQHRILRHEVLGKFLSQIGFGILLVFEGGIEKAPTPERFRELRSKRKKDESGLSSPERSAQRPSPHGYPASP